MTKNSSENVDASDCFLLNLFTYFNLFLQRHHHKKQKNLIQAEGWEAGLGGVANHRAHTRPATPPHLCQH